MAFLPASQIHLNPGQIALALAPGTFGSHTGVVFRREPESDELTVLHLRWNEWAEASPFPGASCWIGAILDIGETSGLAIEELLRDLASKPPVIKYGVNVIEAEGSFIRAGYRKPKASDGLTCATFVWQLLRYGGLNPVAAESWPQGENGEWVIKIAFHLIYDPKRPDAQQGTLVAGAHSGARRIKPTELGVPACHPVEDWPMEYKQVLAEEAPIVATLKQNCPCSA